VRTFDTIEELRAALVEFASRYNETWLVARHGYRTPAKPNFNTFAAISLAPSMQAIDLVQGYLSALRFGYSCGAK
jgi:hypothetical protein